MPQSCSSIRCCDLGLHIPGRAKGGPLEEPAAVILHGGVSEGGVLAAPWWTYTGTKLETVDTAKEHLQLSGAPLLGTKHLPVWPLIKSGLKKGGPLRSATKQTPS